MDGRLGLVAIKRKERLYTEDDDPRCPTCEQEIGTATACCGWKFQVVHQQNVESIAMSDLARSIMVPVPKGGAGKRKRLKRSRKKTQTSRSSKRRKPS